jgi:hypothetical protein
MSLEIFKMISIQQKIISVFFVTPEVMMVISYLGYKKRNHT